MPQLYSSADGTTFDAFGRVMSGTLRLGAQVRVLGEAYSPDDEEDMAEQTVSDLWVFNSRSLLTFLVFLYFLEGQPQ